MKEFFPMDSLVYNGVNHGIFTVFKVFLGFHDFEQSSLNLLRIYIDLDSLTFLSKKEVSFSIHQCFIRRFELESSEILESDSVLLIFGLNSENKSMTLLLLLHRFKSFELLSLFFSFFFLCDRVGFAAFSGEFPLELQRKWFGDDDSLMNL